MAVLIGNISGSSGHNDTLIITGSGFGSKSQAAPIVWDDCSGSTITTLWSGAYPNASNDANFDMKYRTAPYRSINAPHTRVGKYMTGAHGEDLGAAAGYNVMCWKSRTVSSFPQYTYASWYQRCDNAWVFGLGNGDDNFKTYDYSRGAAPYDLPNNWYTEYNPRPTSSSSGCTWHINDDTNSLETSGGSWYGGSGVNPMSGVWTKVEHLIKISNVSGGGRIIIRDNGVTKFDLATRTDNMTGTSRADAIGGYSRNKPNANNFRYFADLYLDYTWQRVMVGNAATLAACTVLECQVPQSWSDTSITVRVNRGKLSDTQSVYLYVYDATAMANTTGFRVPDSATPPAAPSRLRIS